jgi:hypothetical protein
MLMREADDGLYLLPGAPPSWVAGKGLSVTQLPVAYGMLSMTARRAGKTFTVTLDKGIRADAPVRVFWPDRVKPVKVTVDGRSMKDWDIDGIKLTRPFRSLTAEY